MAVLDDQIQSDVDYLTQQPGWQDAGKRADYIREIAVGSRANVDPEEHRAVIGKLWELADDRSFAGKAMDFVGTAVKEVTKSAVAMPVAAGMAATDALGMTDTGSGTRLVEGGKTLLDQTGQRLKQVMPGKSKQAERDELLDFLKQDLDEGLTPDELEAWLAGEYDGKDLPEPLQPWIEGLTRGVAKKAVAADHMGEVDDEKVNAWLQSDRNPVFADSDDGSPGPREYLADYVATRDPRSWEAFKSRVTETDQQRQMRVRRGLTEQQFQADVKGVGGLTGEMVDRAAEMQTSPIDLASAVLPFLRGSKALAAARAGKAGLTKDLALGATKEGAQEGLTEYLGDARSTAEQIAEAAAMGAVGGGVVEASMAGAGAVSRRLVGPQASDTIEGELPGTPPAPPTATGTGTGTGTAAQVEVDGAAYQYDPARITPDALRAAAPETLESLRQAGIIQAPPVATPSAPGAAAPAVTAAPGQPASPWAPPASAPVATPSAPVSSVPMGAPAPGQTATPLAIPASAPVATPSAPVSSVPTGAPAPGQTATPLNAPASAPVATPSAPVPSGPMGAPVPGQTATPLNAPASAPVATPSAPVAAAPNVTTAPGQTATPPAPLASAPVATPSAPVAAAPNVTTAPGQPATPPAAPASAPVATPSAPVAAAPNVTTAPGQPATPPAAPINPRTMDAVVAWADGVIQASRGRMNAGLDPVLLTAHAVKAMKAGLDFASWSADMLRQYGGSVLKHLRAAWDDALKSTGSWSPVTNGQASLAEMWAGIPAITTGPRLIFPTVPSVQGAIQHAAKVMQSWPDQMQANGGRTVVLRHNREGGRIEGLQQHLSTKEGFSGVVVDKFRAAFAGRIPTTLSQAPILITDPQTGNQFYVAQYRDRIQAQGLRPEVRENVHFVQVAPDGTLIGHGDVAYLKSHWARRSQDGPGRQGDFSAVRLSAGQNTAPMSSSEGRGRHDPQSNVSEQLPNGSGVAVWVDPNSGVTQEQAQDLVDRLLSVPARPEGTVLTARTADETARGAVRLLETASPGMAQGARIIRNRSELNEADFSHDAWARLEHAEGFFDPRTGEAVVILDNVRVREGESPTRAVARVLLHERIGHEGLAALRSDPAFAQRWNALVREVMADEAIMAELRAIAADPAYAELGGDPSLLVEEWFARQAEQLTDAELAALKPSSLLAKLWQALKNALAKRTGRFARPQWTAREVREILALSRQALARGESAATRPPGVLRLSAPPSNPGMHPSQFGERVQVDPRLTPEMQAAPVTEFPIQRQQDIHNQARDVIRQQGLAAALATFRDDTTLPIPLRIAGLMQVAQNFDAQSLAARATGDPARMAEADQLVEAAVEAKVALETIGNEAGRNLAMFNTWARLSPDGMLARLERKLAQANQQNPQIPATIPAAMRPKLQQMATAAMALPEGVLRTAAMADLMAEFSMIEGIKTGDLWWSVWYGNVLSGLATQSVNMAGSVENVLLSVLELGTLNPNSLSAYLRGLVRGMRQGAVEAWSVLKGGPLIKPGKWTPPGLSGLELMMRQGGPQTNFSNVREGARSVNQWAAYIASLGGVSRFVGRLLGGMDAIFYYTAHEGAAAVAIQRALRKSGIKPGTPQFRQEVIRQMGGDPAQYQADLQQARAELQAAGRPITKRDVMRRAWELVRERREQGATMEAEGWAARAVYQNELRGSGLWVSGLISQIQRFPLAGRLVVPFNQILSALFSRGLDYTGLGLARGLLGYHLMDLAAPPATGRVRMTPMERRQRAVAGVVGPVVTVAVAAYASQFKEEDDEDIPFWIYDRGPSDKTRRRQMPPGWQPFSIKVGKRYIRYSETPLGPMLAAVAGWLNAERYTQPDTIARRTGEHRLALALQAALLQYQDLGVLSGIAEFMDIINGEERPDKAIQDKGARSLGGLVPVSGLMREIETLFDPTKIHADTVLESLQRDIPIVSGWGTKPDLNAFSEPLTEPGLPVVKRFMTQQREDPNWSWVRRNGLKIPAVDLNDQLEVGRYLLPNEADGTALKDIYAARGWALAAADNGLLTREQRYQFAKRTGELMKERIVIVRQSMESGPTGGVLPADAKIQVGNRMIPARDRLQAQVQAIFEASKKVAMKEVVEMMVK